MANDPISTQIYPEYPRMAIIILQWMEEIQHQLIGGLSQYL